LKHAHTNEDIFEFDHKPMSKRVAELTKLLKACIGDDKGVPIGPKKVRIPGLYLLGAVGSHRDNTVAVREEARAAADAIMKRVRAVIGEER